MGLASGASLSEGGDLIWEQPIRSGDWEGLEQLPQGRELPSRPSAAMTMYMVWSSPPQPAGDGGERACRGPRLIQAEFFEAGLRDAGPGELLSTGESSFVPNHRLKDRECGSGHQRSP